LGIGRTQKPRTPVASLHTRRKWGKDTRSADRTNEPSPISSPPRKCEEEKSAGRDRRGRKDGRTAADEVRWKKKSVEKGARGKKIGESPHRSRRKNRKRDSEGAKCRRRFET